MISVERAKKILFENTQRLPEETVSINHAVNRITSQAIYSPLDLPGFDQSSMDGFAVCKHDQEKGTFKIVGEIQAGETLRQSLKPGEAFRIYTGAPLPENTSGIVIQENALVKGEILRATEPIQPGRYIRTKGSQLAVGECAIENETFLNPAAIGLIASLGITELNVFKHPKIALLITGNEVIEPGNPLEFGQIYDSNSYSLIAALKQLNIAPTSVLRVKDRLAVLVTSIEQQLERADILVITGGISVGKYDLVHEALQEFGVETLFYKVAQKPGKPMYAAKLNGKLILALPGNPAAILVGFYEYLLPVIRKMSGVKQYELPKQRVKVAQEIRNREDRALFLRAVYDGGRVNPLDKQDSNMLHSFSLANCLLYIPKGVELIAENELAEIHMLPTVF